jgi:hypothetical protein
MNGDMIVTTRASCQQKMKQIRQLKNSPKAASTAIPRDSVVNPFTDEMSSVRILVKIPGALFLLSNHPMSFLKID